MTKPKRNKPNVQAPAFTVSPSETDPLGSWTGVPEDRQEMPVQDADDL